MRTYSVLIPVALSATQPGATKIDVDANFVKILLSDSPTGTLVIRAESVRDNVVLADHLVMGVGDKAIFPRNVDSFTFYNFDTLAVRQPTVVIGKGNYEQSSIAGSVSISGGSINVANLSPAGDITSVADTVLAAATSADFAANANRRETVIQANLANTGALDIIATTGTASGGVHLQAGERMVITTSGAYRIRNNTGANQTYSILNVNNT